MTDNRMQDADHSLCVRMYGTRREFVDNCGYQRNHTNKQHEMNSTA